jgi:hypothetical protein
MLSEPYLINEVKVDWITFARVGKWFLFTFTEAPRMGFFYFYFYFILISVFLLLGRSPMVEVKLRMYVDLGPFRTIGIHV